MTPRPARRLRALAVVGAIAGARWAAADGLVAEPTVEVVELAAGGSSAGSGSVVIRNTSAAPVVATGIVAEPGCDAAAVHAAPLGAFMLMPGATQPITITCSPGPASMQRCSYQVRASGNAVLLEFEAVCAYAGATSLEPDLAALDFGTVAVGGAASRTVALHNAGAAPINRLFVETTDLAGNFAVAAPCNPDARECDAAIPVLAAGATTAMVVTCTPRAPGAHTAALHIASSAGTRLAAPIALTCSGSAASTPVLSATPGALDLGAVELVGAGQTATVHVANAGKGSLRLIAIELLDGGTGAAADWTVTPRGSCAAGVPPTCILGETEAADLDLAFEPRALGVRDATLVLDFRDTADRSISIPLHGIGAGPTLQVVGGPAALDFGTLPLATAGALTLQVANHGTRNLTDGVLAVSPAGPPFSISPASNLAVTTAATTPVTVTCTPAAAGKTTAMLQLSAPDVPGPPLAIALHCAGDPAQALVATPPAVLLGEIRTATSKVSPIQIASTGAPIALTAADLETAIAGLSVTGAPATTPATLELIAAPPLELSLDDRVIVKPTPGQPLAIAVTGTAVTASYTAPTAISLGAFCVKQPTAPRILALTSLGSGTIGLSAPALQNPDSPFDLAPVAPLGYPNVVAAGQRAVISVTPKRRA
ncbi:MAG TPA: choice-of-anchor D domain-containing protein, partial [Kofleriaceae bacterium]|nr:choice-of-anchor D domain-containing protein [Kofleriaceae bacterium]